MTKTAETWINASIKEDLDLLKHLKKIKAPGINDVDPDEDGWTALYHAVYNNNKSVVDFLLKCGADVNQLDDDKGTVLFWAANKGKVPIIKLLLKKGANVDVIDVDGNNVLWTAVAMGRTEVISVLLDAGADPLLVNKEGLTIFDRRTTKSSGIFLDKVKDKYTKMKKVGKFKELLR